MNSYEIQALIDTKKGEIKELKKQLRSKDYIGTKIAMGRATKTEYKAQIDQCDEWAAQINTLESDIDNLNVQLEEAVEQERQTEIENN